MFWGIIFLVYSSVLLLLWVLIIVIKLKIFQDGKNLPAVQRAYHINELKSNPELLVDVKFYLAQQIHPVVSRLCEPIDGADSGFVAECLGLDPSTYRKAISKSEKVPETSSIDQYILSNDLEAFK